MRGGGAAPPLAVDLRRARAARRPGGARGGAAGTRGAGTAAPAVQCRAGTASLSIAFATGFAEHAWTPFGLQEEVWRAYLAGENVLIHAATGTGKT